MENRKYTNPATRIIGLLPISLVASFYNELLGLYLICALLTVYGIRTIRILHDPFRAGIMISSGIYFFIGTQNYSQERLQTYLSERTIILIAISLSFLLLGNFFVEFFQSKQETILPLDDKFIHVLFHKYPATFQIVIFSSAIYLLAIFNFMYAGIPILSGNIDGLRFTSERNLASQLRLVIIPGLQASVLISLLPVVFKRRLSFSNFILSCIGIVFLTAFGARYVVLLPIVSLLILRIWAFNVRLVTIFASASVLGVLTAAVGFFRLTLSKVSYLDYLNILRRNEENEFIAVFVSSLQTGIFTMQRTLDSIPSSIPFQHGVFMLRDAAGLIPGVKSVGSDRWLTESLLQYSFLSNGGLPPTFLGGFFIDFGIPGMFFLSLCIGPLMYLIFKHQRKVITLRKLCIMAILGAWLTFAPYSYISFKATLIIFLAFIYFLLIGGKSGMEPCGVNEHTACK